MRYFRQVFASTVALFVLAAPAGAQPRTWHPVTDATLANPDQGDWLQWRRTNDDWGYSPLDQINRSNVKQLQLVWSWGVNPGASEEAPLVHDGIMFIPNPGGGVQAVDAATGDLLWEYKRRYENGELSTGAMRSLALYGDKVFVGTRDAHLVALDARTGAVVWDHTVADHALGYEYSSGPIIAKGHVIAGMTGCTRYKFDVCFISAHDPDTGRELWRTSTIARPGEPGGDTWG